MLFPRLDDLWVGFILRLLQGWLVAGILTGAADVACAQEPLEIAANSEERVVKDALPPDKSIEPSVSLFSVGGLAQMETSTYFASEWYLDPAHSVKRDVEDIDMTGNLAKGLADGALWETTGLLPRGQQPAGDQNEGEKAGCAPSADSGFINSIPGGVPMIVGLCSLALFSFLWECSSSIRRVTADSH